MDDKKIINKIRDYILDNDISVYKLAEASGIPYHRLWFLLNKSQTINVADYIAICNAIKEPIDLFLKGDKRT